MIRRNEFNKILQLMDAGILTSEKQVTDLIDQKPAYLNIDNYTYNLKDKTHNKSSTNINDDIAYITLYINKFNDFEELKLSKNKITLYYDIKPISISINIEDIQLGLLELKNNLTTTNDSIQKFELLVEEEIIKISNYLSSVNLSIPTDSNFDFSDLDIINEYYNKYSVTKDYSGNSSNDFLWLFENLTFKVNYSITIEYNKGVQHVN